MYHRRMQVLIGLTIVILGISALVKCDVHNEQQRKDTIVRESGHFAPKDFGFFLGDAAIVELLALDRWNVAATGEPKLEITVDDEEISAYSRKDPEIISIQGSVTIRNQSNKNVSLSYCFRPASIIILRIFEADESPVAVLYCGPYYSDREPTSFELAVGGKIKESIELPWRIGASSKMLSPNADYFIVVELTCGNRVICRSAKTRLNVSAVTD